MFSSIEDVVESFGKHNYIASRRIATVVYLAAAMKKPVLVEGPAGVGKTDLAKVLAASLGEQMIRLQCYEGLDEGKALYEWEYAKQLLYTQILKDKVSEVLVGTNGLAEAVDKIASEDEVFFSERFIVPRPLMKAINSEEQVVLLIDEIDKADAEFEAFLLELLSDFQVTVPEIGTFKAKKIPLVILTSNNAREMSDALKRRCLHLYIDFPNREQELAMVAQQVRETLAGGERVKEAQLHAGVAQAAPVSAAQPERSEAIEQHAHAHIARARGAQRADKAGGQSAGGDQVHLQQHVAAGVLDGSQHAREEDRVLVQEAESVSGSPRPAGGCKLLRLDFRA